MSLQQLTARLGIVLAVIVAPSTVLGQGLLGSEVAAELLYPNISSVAVGPINAMVGIGEEFPPGAFVPERNFSINITDSQIIYFAGEQNSYDIAEFNGFGLHFTGAPNFNLITLDATSSLVPTSFQWDSNSLFFDLSGLAVTPTDQIVFNVNPIPEPSALLMIAGGLGAVVALRLRKRAARASE